MPGKTAFIVGARPNFMKIAPILNAVKAFPKLSPILIHTGQHYDRNLSDVFFEELNVQKPDVYLGIGSGSHGEQTSRLILELEREFASLRDGDGLQRVIVVGDVNSTMAATLAAVKLHIPVAHVEAGLRSFDRRMPEEINRLVTDAICDMLLVSEPDGVNNLVKEGKSDDEIFLVGNVMIDTLLAQVDKAKQCDTLEKFSVEPGNFCTVTLHRPSNVDDPEILRSLVDVLLNISADLKMVFPVHPRTKKKLDDFGIWKDLESAENIHCAGPLGYHDFLCLTSQSKVIVTDSGGLQEESTALGVPCLTMRENTERPITVTDGTSTLVGNDATHLKLCLHQVIDGSYKKGRCPELWDGKASERIAKILAEDAQR